MIGVFSGEDEQEAGVRWSESAGIKKTSIPRYRPFPPQTGDSGRIHPRQEVGRLSSGEKEEPQSKDSQTLIFGAPTERISLPLDHSIGKFTRGPSPPALLEHQLAFKCLTLKYGGMDQNQQTIESSTRQTETKINKQQKKKKKKKWKEIDMHNNFLGVIRGY